MISKAMEEAINQQINREFYSAYLYLAMAQECESIGLKGSAKWFTLQYHEEISHGMKMVDYLNDQGARVVLDAIEKPPVEFGPLVTMFEKTAEHERFVTKSIYSLVDLAVKEKDYATQEFLQWFVKEQVEEEANADEIVKKLEFVGTTNHGLYLLDKELGARGAD